MASPALPTNLTDIANLALGLIGEKTINNIETVSDPLAQAVRRWVQTCIREVQTMVIWDELYTGPIQPDSVTDQYAGVEGQFQFVIPTDFLQIIETNSFPPNTLPSQLDSRFSSQPVWKLQNGFIIARVETFEMFYQRFDPNPAAWSVQMTALIYTYLAAKIAYQISDSVQVAEQLKRDYAAMKMQMICSRQNRARARRTRPSGFAMVRQKRTSAPQQFP